MYSYFQDRTLFPVKDLATVPLVQTTKGTIKPDNPPKYDPLYKCFPILAFDDSHIPTPESVSLLMRHLKFDENGFITHINKRYISFLAKTYMYVLHNIHNPDPQSVVTISLKLKKHKNSKAHLPASMCKSILHTDPGTAVILGDKKNLVGYDICKSCYLKTQKPNADYMSMFLLSRTCQSKFYTSVLEPYFSYPWKWLLVGRLFEQSRGVSLDMLESKMWVHTINATMFFLRQTLNTKFTCDLCIAGLNPFQQSFLKRMVDRKYMNAFDLLMDGTILDELCYRERAVLPEKHHTIRTYKLIAPSDQRCKDRAGSHRTTIFDFHAFFRVYKHKQFCLVTRATGLVMRWIMNCSTARKIEIQLVSPEFDAYSGSAVSVFDLNTIHKQDVLHIKHAHMLTYEFLWYAIGRTACKTLKLTGSYTLSCRGDNTTNGIIGTRCFADIVDMAHIVDFNGFQRQPDKPSPFVLTPLNESHRTYKLIYRADVAMEQASYNTSTWPPAIEQPFPAALLPLAPIYGVSHTFLFYILFCILIRITAGRTRSPRKDFVKSHDILKWAKPRRFETIVIEDDTDVDLRSIQCIEAVSSAQDELWDVDAFLKSLNLPLEPTNVHQQKVERALSLIFNAPVNYDFDEGLFDINFDDVDMTHPNAIFTFEELCSMGVNIAFLNYRKIENSSLIYKFTKEQNTHISKLRRKWKNRYSARKSSNKQKDYTKSLEDKLKKALTTLDAVRKELEGTQVL